MKVKQVVKPKVDAFLGWLGGKTKLRPTIINCMPQHSCYVEVFAGSATVFFGKPPTRNEIINDIHGELVNLAKVISGTYFDDDIWQEFVHYVRTMPASRQAFQEWQKWEDEKLDQLNYAQRAFVYYYCIKKGFSSVKAGGYEASPFSSSRYNMNTDFERFCNRFRQSNAQIENMDFRSLFKKYNQPKGPRKISPVLFFCDPPYFVADDTNYYEHVFNHQDHMDFKKCCDEVHENDNRFLITYDDCPEVTELYKDYYLYRTDPIVYSASDEKVARGTAKCEIFITNYDLVKMLSKKNSSRNKFGTNSVNSNDKVIEFPKGKKADEDFIGLTRIN